MREIERDTFKNALSLFDDFVALRHGSLGGC